VKAAHAVRVVGRGLIDTTVGRGRKRRLAGDQAIDIADRALREGQKCRENDVHSCPSAAVGRSWRPIRNTMVLLGRQDGNPHPAECYPGDTPHGEVFDTNRSLLTSERLLLSDRFEGRTASSGCPAHLDPCCRDESLSPTQAADGPACFLSRCEQGQEREGADLHRGRARKGNDGQRAPEASFDVFSDRAAKHEGPF
jgi:hypothetical protein